MASTSDQESIIYAFLDRNNSAVPLDDTNCMSQEGLLHLFKLKIAEMKNLLNAMAPEDKQAAWEHWEEIQDSIRMCFGQIAEMVDQDRTATKELETPDETVSMGSHEQLAELKSGCKEAANSSIAETTVLQEAVNPIAGKLDKTSLVVSLQNLKERTYVQDCEGKEYCSASETKDETHSKIEGSQTECHTEISTLTNSVYKDKTEIEMTDRNSLDIDGVVSALTELSPIIKSRLDNANTSANEKVIHFKVENVDGSVQNLTLSAELSAHDQKLFILQNENGLNRLHLKEEKVAAEISETGEVHEVKTGEITDSEVVTDKIYSEKTESSRVHSDELLGKRLKMGRTIIVKDKKKIGRPKREDFDELCIPVKTNDGRQVFTCKLCGVQKDIYAKLEVHLQSHTGRRPFSCSICSKSFTTKGNLKEHEQTHNNNRPEFKCEECGKVFKQLKCLRVHSRVHRGEKPFRCHICGQAFAQGGVLKRHLLRHSDEKDQLCPICGKAFKLKASLDHHKKRHENRRDFKCTECSFASVTKNDLLRHMVKHTREKRFTCSICSKKFTRANYLNEHMNTHTGATPFECSECGAAFSLTSKLCVHKKKHRRGLAETQVRETQSETVETQSVILQDNQTGSPKQNINTITLLHDPENQSNFDVMLGNTSVLIQKTETGLRIVNQTDGEIESDTAVLGNENVSVPVVTEGSWPGEECVKLVIGHNISGEDLQKLINSKIINLN